MLSYDVSDICVMSLFFFFQAEDGIRDLTVTGVQTCALPISQDPLTVTDGEGPTPTGSAVPRRRGLIATRRADPRLGANRIGATAAPLLSRALRPQLMEVSTPSVQARLALLLVLVARTRSETYGFVAVLGNDTTSVERVARTGHRIIGDAIGRSPTVTRRHWEAGLGPNGVIAHWSMDTDIPNGPPDGRHLHHTATFTDTVTAFTRGTSAGPRSLPCRKRDPGTC